MLVAALILAVVVTLCALLAAPTFVRLAEQLRRTITEVEKVVTVLDDRLLPRTEETLAQTNQAVRDLEATAELFRGVQTRAEGVLAPLGEIVVGVEHAFEPMVRMANESGLDRRRVRAFGVGLRVSWTALRRSVSRSRVVPALDSPDRSIDPS